MALTTAQIQQAYVTFFSRPADVAGLNYWSSYTGSIANLYATFAQSAEYAAAFNNLSNGAKVNLVYQNLFGRPAEAEGLNYWTLQLDQGAVTVANLALALSAGAQGSDATTVANRVVAATAFTNELDTAAEILAYSGATANAAAKAWLAGVTTDASLAAAIAPATLTASVASVTTVGSVVPGQTFTLTVGADTINGTAGNDTINALTINPVTGEAATTLGAFDVIDGGAGTDTLNIYANATHNKAQVGTVRNVEIINIFNEGTIAANQFGGVDGVDASKFEGAQQLWQIANANTVNKLGASTTAGFRNIEAGNLEVNVADTAASATVALDNVDDATSLDIDAAATKGLLTTVTVAGAVVDANDDGVDAIALGVTVGKDVQTLTLSTSVDVDLTVTDNGKDVTSLQAAASAGGIKFDGGTTFATIATGAGKDDVTLKATLDGSATKKLATVSTGAGDDSITVNTVATGAGNKIVIDAGDGKDTVTITARGTASLDVNLGAGDDKIVLGANALLATDKIVGGDGRDTLSLNGKVFTVVDADLIASTTSGFEVLETTGGGNTTIDATRFAQFETLVFKSTGTNTVTKASGVELVAHTSLTATATGYDASATPKAYGGALTVTAQAAAAPANQTLTLNGDSAAVTVKAASGTTGAVAASQDAAHAAIVNGDLKTLSIATVNGVDDAKLAVASAADTLSYAVVDVTTTNLQALTTLTLTGNGTVEVSNTGATKLATIDASGLGGTLAFGSNAGDVTGGLIFVGSVDVAETITLGAGADEVEINSTYAKMDIIIGFDASKETNNDKSVTDTLTFGGVTLDGSAPNQIAKVANVQSTDSLLVALEKAVIASAADTDAVVFFNLAGDTYVVKNTGANSLDDGDLVVKLTGTIDFASDWGVFAA